MKHRVLGYPLLLSLLFGIAIMLRAALPSASSGTWVAAGDMSAVRSAACTVVLRDGRLLVSGGADANGPTASVDRFSTTGIWSAAASMNSPRSHQSCAVLPDGRVLVAGGTTSGGGIMNSAEIYDPNANSWTQAGVMNDARWGATASVLQDGRVLIAGGQGSGAALNTLEIFDPTSDNFSNAGTLSSPRQDQAAAVLSDGRVLIAGGSSDGANALNTTEIYDPQAGSVSLGPTMSTPRAKHTATTLLDGAVVVIGGSDYTNDLTSTEVFDPAANNFTAASSLATPRSKHLAFLLPNNNEVLVVGGLSAGTDLASVELYIPWQKAFQATGAMATPRSDATGAALTAADGYLLMAGGTALSSTEMYAFSTVKTDAADYAPGTVVNITGSGWQPGETVTLTLVEFPLIDTHPTMTAVADSNGNISNSQFSPDSHDVNIRFYLTAVGGQSGMQAQNTFTDAGPKPTSTITSPANNASYNTAGWAAAAPIAGTVSFASGTTGRAVNVSIKRNGTTNKYWNGTGFTNTSEVFFTATLNGGQTGWSLSFSASNFPADDSYTVHSQAVDSNGTESGNTAAIFTLDNVVPSAPPAPSLASGSDTGASQSDEITNLTSNLKFSGSAEGNSTVNLFVDGSPTATGTGTANNSGAYNNVNISGPFSEGTHTIRATATDQAGNSSALGSTLTITVDTTAPVLGLSPASGTVNTPFSFSWNITDPTSGGVSSGVNTSTCLVKLDAATVSTACSGTHSITTAGAHTVLVSATDIAGNAGSDSRSYTVVVDNQAPVLTVNFAAPDGQNSWYVHSPVLGTVSANDTTTGDSNVTSISCTDGVTPLTVGGLTGIGTPSVSGSISVSGEGSHNISCQATDSAGNTGAFTGSTAMPVVVKIDTVAPSLTATRLTAANGNGWNNSDVSVRLACTDSTSGVASIAATGAATGSATTSPLDLVVTTEGANQSVNGTCADAAGNSATPAGISNINIDKTKPVIAGSRNPAANRFGWNNVDVMVGFTCAETGIVQSGIDTNTVAGTTVTAEGTNQSATNTGSCVDVAGNAADSSTVSGISIDKTPPNAPTPARTPSENGAGWNNTDVNVSFTSNGDAGAAQSGIDSCTTSSNLTAETNGTDVSGTCTDKAGNVSIVAKVTVKIDQTKPVITGSRNPAANTFGWNNVDVMAGFTCAETGAVQSGVATNNVAGATVSTEGTNQSVTNTGSCVDVAGNAAYPSTVTNINIDKTKPTASAARDLPPNAYGWNNATVTVTFTGSDSLSGIASCDSQVALANEGANLSASGTCKDNADNVSDSASVTGINIDKTKPVITGSRSPVANSYGWNNTDVTVSFTCADAGYVQSGISNNTATGATLSGEGAGQFVINSGDCTDKAGNASIQSTVGNVNIDKTNPTITLTITPGSPAATGWYNISTGQPTVSFTCNDAISGQASCTLPVLVGEGSNQTISGTATDKAGNSASTSIMHVNVDVTAPTVNLVNPANGGSYLLNQSANASYSCADTGSSGLVAGSTGCVGPVASGSAFDTASVGSKIFTVSAKDVAGNTASKEASYGVSYSTGACLGDLGHTVLQPINATGTMSVFKLGSTVPTKFRVCDANGVSIGIPGVVKGYGLVGAASTPDITVDEDVYSTTPDAAFRWDPTSQQWIFNQSTKNNGTLNKVGAIYYFGINLNDGSWIYFQYGLR